MKRSRDIKQIRHSRFFDRQWYSQSYPEQVGNGDPAQHYLMFGADAGLDPGPEFSTKGYLASNSDVAAANLNPLLHYELYGRAEGRQGYAHYPTGQSIAAKETLEKTARHAVIVHAYHLDCFAELARALAAFPTNVDRYVSYPRGSTAHSAAVICAAFPGAIPMAVDNIGQDIGAFLQVLERIDRSKYDFYCKLHSKGGDKLPTLWREALLTGTVGNAERVAQFVRFFQDSPEVLLGGAQELFLHGPSYVMANGPRLAQILAKTGLPADLLDQDWGFFAGSFFWIRNSLVEQMLACLCSADFAPDAVQRDGQLAHAGERLAGVLAQAAGGQMVLASCVDPMALVTRFDGLPTDAPRRYIPMIETLQALQSRWIGRQADAMVAGREPGLGFSRARKAANLAQTGQGDYAIITPTGDRPVAFNRCIQMVATQTVRPKEWIVVDDGVTPLTDQLCLPDWATYIRRAPKANDPPHTLSCNVLAALEHVTADRVLIFEDDDWYSPLYAEFMLPWLEIYDMVGLNLIRYYHLQGSAWKNGHPPAHTAFAQTGFRRGHAWAHLAAVCRTGFTEIREKGIIDRHWWQTFEGTKTLINDHPCLHLGLKGGFGRPGLASGHERREIDYKPDPEGEYLQQIIGPDRLYYERWRKGFRKPFVIYTTALGHEAAQKLPAAKRALFDFFAFTDVPKALAKPWQAIPFDALGDDAEAAIAKVQRLPHLYFPDYEWSIWGDPDTLLQEDLEQLIARVIDKNNGSCIAGPVSEDDRFRYASCGGRAVGAALKHGRLVIRCHPAPADSHNMINLWKALSLT